MTVAKE